MTGHASAGDPPSLNADALRDATGVPTVEAHASLGSTNDRARELLDGDTVLPALVVAREQTAGRGRGANRWWSTDGALTFSLVVGRETARPAAAGVLSVLTGLALADAVDRASGVRALVKWPNDLVIGVRKTAGVLIESPRPGSHVVGVGLNLNNSFEGAPTDVRERSVAIASVAKRRVSPNAVLAAFLDGWRHLQRQAAAGDPEPMRRAAEASALTGSAVLVRPAVGPPIEGIATGIDADGALVVEATGVVMRVVSGTVARWGTAPDGQAGRST
ncbi:MAG: biotin--[acetyl-CoA-carboxylase] ligase [Planctomycetota bacterium]